MDYRQDDAAVSPMIELTLDHVDPYLRCGGTLDARTRWHVLEAAEVLLARRPSHICIDLSDVRIADVDGANALANLQRMARDAGAALSWRGLDADRLQGLLPLRHRPTRPNGPPSPVGSVGARSAQAAC